MPAYGSASATVTSSPPSSAAVLEYLCLFTHDLRRKQKRWQDGRLKFHTFNKRVMVYDERGNFIGDMHWRADYDFGEGEEVQLERGGVMVQVSECVGQQQQDLTELLDKRAKEKEQRQQNAASRPPGPQLVRSAMPAARGPQPDHFQLRHRPLHQLIGTPTGHHGRAVVPAESPYEGRHPVHSPGGQDPSRSAKRRKLDSSPPSKKGYAQNLFGQTLTLSATPLSSAPLRHRPAAEMDAPVELDDTLLSTQTVTRPEKYDSVDDSRTRRVAEPVPAAARSVTDQWKNGQVEKGAKPTQRRVTNGQERGAPEEVTRGVSKGLKPAAEDAPDVTAEGSIAQANQKGKRAKSASGQQIGRESNDWSKDTPLEYDRGTPGPSKLDKIRVRDESSGIRSSSSVQTKSASKVSAPAADANDEGKLALQFQETLTHMPEEPRTELRIKPRKRRGLMMMAEQRTLSSGGQQPLKPNEEAAPRDTSVSRKQSKGSAVPGGDDPFGTLSREGQQPDALPETKETSNGRATIAALRKEPLHDRSPNITQNWRRNEKEEPNRIGSHLDEDDEDGDVMMLDDTVGKHTELLEKQEAELTVDSGEGSTKEHVTNKDEEARRANTERRASATNAEDSTPSADSDTGASRSKRRRTRKAASKRPAPAPERYSEDDSSFETASRKRRSTRSSRNKVDTDDVAETGKNCLDNGAPQEAPAGPRLARLSKKGIKSREVIGFVLDDAQIFRGFGMPPPLMVKDTPLQPPVAKVDTFVSRSHAAVTGATTSLGREHRRSASDDPINAVALYRETLASSNDTNASRTSPSALTVKTAVSAHDLPPEDSGGDLPQDSSGVQEAKVRSKNPTPPLAQRRSVNGLSLHNSFTIPDANKVDTGATLPDMAAAADDGALKPAQPPRRIANPASRGRKAALKSDAAGKVPQPVLPTEPGPAPNPTRVNEAQKETKPIKKMRFPGFVSAKGSGPWSREADDLLERPRPS